MLNTKWVLFCDELSGSYSFEVPFYTFLQHALWCFYNHRWQVNVRLMYKRSIYDRLSFSKQGWVEAHHFSPNSVRVIDRYEKNLRKIPKNKQKTLHKTLAFQHLQYIILWKDSMTLGKSLCVKAKVGCHYWIGCATFKPLRHHSMRNYHSILVNTATWTLGYVLKTNVPQY